ncbi:hypothetical protein GGI04_002018 [Coemansia thaxteri]|uniref:Uncharacterized protein n=1 Tax=Coemansia thaxteri TaxID=2663907 RepID=A0A9W8EGJ3_9FUNG|nr:hypothetical protein H4R26_004660 [Coemansia thaxteri]KAJ2006045.1 hypothetical protein GGI04_002018 [Coemansia thaxteri]KAJ2330679.1 hypothetical protein GGH92_009462 [Coemansia sp. RSA 2673]KAJ2481186.1 hypothetical protein EV174_003540 [Coemansia sp. RSA 2320]
MSADLPLPPAKSSGIIRDIASSIFEPGVNRGVLVVMNSAFAGLFVILAYLLFATGFNIHVCALALIALSLFASIQWFVKEATASKINAASVGSKSSGNQPLATAAAKSGPNKNKKKKL